MSFYLCISNVFYNTLCLISVAKAFVSVCKINPKYKTDESYRTIVDTVTSALNYSKQHVII